MGLFDSIGDFFGGAVDTAGDFFGDLFDFDLDFDFGFGGSDSSSSSSPTIPTTTNSGDNGFSWGDALEVGIPSLIGGAGNYFLNQAAADDKMDLIQFQEQQANDRLQQQLAAQREALEAQLAVAKEEIAAKKKIAKFQLLQNAFFKIMEASQGGRANEAAALTNLTSAVQNPLLRR